MLGATEVKLTYIICKEFIILILISNLIAWPIAFLSAANWLNEFAYRINIEFSFFIIAGLLSVIIAVLTVSFQAIKAALANPVTSLRYE